MGKPRVIVSTGFIRAVRRTQDWVVFEVADGHDRMGVKRWRDLEPEKIGVSHMRDLVSHVERKRKRRSPRA